jgi:hypothetical protein
MLARVVWFIVLTRAATLRQPRRSHTRRSVCRHLTGKGTAAGAGAPYAIAVR